MRCLSCRNVNFEIKTGDPHTRLGAATPCVYAIIPYNIIMIMLTLEYLFVSDDCFLFYTGNCLNLFYRKKVISQLKLTGKIEMSPYSLTRK